MCIHVFPPGRRALTAALRLPVRRFTQAAGIAGHTVLLEAEVCGTEFNSCHCAAVPLLHHQWTPEYFSLSFPLYHASCLFFWGVGGGLLLIRNKPFCPSLLVFLLGWQLGLKEEVGSSGCLLIHWLRKEGVVEMFSLFVFVEVISEYANDPSANWALSSAAINPSISPLLWPSLWQRPCKWKV